jgi:hypothetical protein
VCLPAEYPVRPCSVDLRALHSDPHPGIRSMPKSMVFGGNPEPSSRELRERLRRDIDTEARMEPRQSWTRHDSGCRPTSMRSRGSASGRRSTRLHPDQGFQADDDGKPPAPFGAGRKSIANLHVGLLRAADESKVKCGMRSDPVFVGDGRIMWVGWPAARQLERCRHDDAFPIELPPRGLPPPAATMPRARRDAEPDSEIVGLQF